MARVRINLPKQPEWDNIWQGWTTKFISKNKWKCDDTYDFEDHMQDAYMVFLRVKSAYPAITEVRHLMSLYQTALRNEFIDKAQQKRQKYKMEVSLESVVGEDLRLIDTLGESNNEGYLRVLISELPTELQALLSTFTDDEKLALLRKKGTQSRLAKRAGFPKRRTNLNGALCRLLGLPPGTDLHGKLRSAIIE